MLLLPPGEGWGARTAGNGELQRTKRVSDRGRRSYEQLDICVHDVAVYSTFTRRSETGFSPE